MTKDLLTKLYDATQAENAQLKAWLDAIVDGNSFDYNRANALNQYQNFRDKEQR